MKKEIGETSYKETAFGIIPRSKLIPLEIEGTKRAWDFVIDQLKSAIEGLSVRDLNNLVVAYEPVWAIGSGLSDTPDNAMSMAILIKKTISNKFSKKRPIKVKVLYGGSVNHENAHKFLKQESIDGALVGRASLDPKSFAEIVKSF